mmetsp:Transcript_23494/g.38881  ORF Transcript_23494/g.38881 Transcript_23494/m.38881 type:complete len:131 (+) Transcript_23494:449-841(+)
MQRLTWKMGMTMSPMAVISRYWLTTAWSGQLTFHTHATRDLQHELLMASSSLLDFFIDRYSALTLSNPKVVSAAGWVKYEPLCSGVPGKHFKLFDTKRKELLIYDSKIISKDEFLQFEPHARSEGAWSNK